MRVTVCCLREGKHHQYSHPCDRDLPQGDEEYVLVHVHSDGNVGMYVQPTRSERGSAELPSPPPEELEHHWMARFLFLFSSV